MKKTIKALRTPAIVLLLVTSFIACDKDFYVLDSDVLGKDNANFNTKFETLPIVAYNKKLDSLQINNLPSSLLGFFNDPQFGPTTASIVTQILPLVFEPDFGTNPTVDSVVLRIPYFSTQDGTDGEIPTYNLDSIYCDSKAPIKLSIYENGYFLRDFDPDNLGEAQNFYSHASNGSADNFARTNNTLINFDDFKGATLLDEMNFIPDSTVTITTTTTDTLVTLPSFRTKLDNAFWQAAIIDKHLEGGAELSNANNFRNYFRGLYFKAEGLNNTGNMSLLNLASTDALITIHYSKDDEDNAGERLQDAYTFNFNGNRLNTFINNFSMSFANGDRDLGDEKLYLKGTEGSMAVVNLFDGLVDCDGDGNIDDDPLKCFKDRFRIPIAPFGENDYLKDETTGDFVLNKLINEAHIVVYEDEGLNNGGDEDFHRYDRIYAYDIKNNTPLVDYLIDPIENVASPINSKIFHLSQRDPDSLKYKIRITEHLNNILLRDSTNTKIGLVPSSNVNITTNSEISQSGDVVTGVPSASIITPRGTALYGSNANVPSGKRMKLKLFFTEPKEVNP